MFALSVKDTCRGDVKVKLGLPTFSISKSLPRFWPRPVPGTEEFLSSLSRVELKSEPAAFFLVEAGVALVGAVRWRCAMSNSRLRSWASCLFSSVSLRRRS